MVYKQPLSTHPGNKTTTLAKYHDIVYINSHSRNTEMPLIASMRNHTILEPMQIWHTKRTRKREIIYYASKLYTSHCNICMNNYGSNMLWVPIETIRGGGANSSPGS